MKENILYIDDEKANMDAFRMVFGDEYNIILCTDAKAVFKALKENVIKVVVSDQRMPEITGLDLCERINKIYPDIVCIILTAFADVGVAVQAINQGGIYRFMLKPWDKEDMQIALGNALYKYNLQAENKALIKSLEDKNKDLEKAKKEVEKSEAKQSSMIANISDVIGILSKEGEIVYKSPNVTSFFGWIPEDIVGTDALSATHPNDLNRIQEEFKKVLEKDNNQTTVEYRYKCKDGTYKPVHLTAVNLVNNPLINGILINYHDISARREDEMEILAVNEELRATSDVLIENEVKLELQNKELIDAKEKAEDNERKLKTLIGNLSGVVYRCKNDESWTMEFLSEYAYDLSGYKADDFIENKIRKWTDIIHPDFRQIIWDDVQKALEKRTSFYLSFKIICADGTEKWVSENGQGIYSNNELIAIEGIIYDITIQKQVEQDLIIAKEKAEESDRLKSSFLANMSHEIRTPLNGIMGFAQLLLKANLPKDKQGSFLNIILNNSQQLLSILNDILDISKIETGQIVLRKESVNINNLMDELHEFHSLQAKKKDIIVELYKDFDEVLIIKTDNTKLYQILNNLMSNALKFTEKGKIKLGYKVNTNNLEFFVEDTGIGIATDIQSKIFDRFYQGDNSSIRVYGGNGLGLTITKSLVEFMGGAIKVNSELGLGSKFTVTLPMKDMPQKKVEVKKESVKKEEVTMADDQTLLIVEDDATNFLYLKEVVEDYFKEIIHAENGIKAVDICKENKNINLILMDMKMPGMDGFEATRQIKKMLPNVPIIAQTAYAFNEDKVKALEAGCDDYVSKPIELQTLIDIVNKYKK